MTPPTSPMPMSFEEWFEANKTDDPMQDIMACWEYCQSSMQPLIEEREIAELKLELRN